eukprot:m.1056321 g.1056321  ORF g.1056321 m.1056321 type:complete len:233 (-) comp24198_c0_seq10:3643-4341(-)
MHSPIPTRGCLSLALEQTPSTTTLGHLAEQIVGNSYSGGVHRGASEPPAPPPAAPPPGLATEAHEQKIRVLQTEHASKVAALEQIIQEKTDALALVETELVAMDREMGLKDKLIALLQRQLRAEQDSRREQAKCGITFSELQDRLVKSQTDLAHGRAVLDLQTHRIAGAMQQVAYYKSVVDGAAVDHVRCIRALGSDERCPQDTVRVARCMRVPSTGRFKDGSAVVSGWVSA